WRLGRDIDALMLDNNEVSVVTGQNNPGEVGRIVVMTYNSMAHTASYRRRSFGFYDLSWVDLLLIPDALTALWKNTSWRLRYADRARLVGFLAEGTRLSPLEKDQLTAFFGFHTITIPCHGHRERLMRLAHYTIRGGMPLPASLRGVPLRRRGLWHHD